ncbi:MAG: thiosulfate sulfurtransferase [Myxococcales bacterium]
MLGRFASLVPLVALLLAGRATAASSTPAASAVEGPGVSASQAWLAQHARDPGVRILDARPPEAYAKAHIPGAVNVPVAETLDPDQMHNLPAAQAKLEALFSRAGVAKDTIAVAYDNGGETPAARLFWTLELLGQEHAAVLDGGLAAWTKAGGAVTAQPTQAAPARFTATPQAAPRIASRAQVARALGDGRTIIIDARSPAEYRGDDLRAKFGGHIPGAVNVDWRANLEADGRLKPPAALAAIYQGAGATPDKEVIAHCQTGQRSAVTYWALRALGYPKVENYAGSWVEWGNDPKTPKAQRP